MIAILLIINITLLALMLYYKKMLKIEKLKNVKNVNAKKTTTDPDAEVKKLMRQTGLTYDLALQIHQGHDKISAKSSNNKIKKPFNEKY